MDELGKAREIIDEIDGQLVPLFEKRMRAGEQVARAKQKSGDTSVFRPEREKQVLERAEAVLEDKRFSAEVRQFMGAVMDINKDFQKRVLFSSEAVYPRGKMDGNAVVGFFGDNGSHSDLACEKFFPDAGKRVSCPTFRDVFEKLKAGEISFGVVPIENSSTGSISDVYDLLGEYDFFIAAERWERIRQHLAGMRGAKESDIKEVYSHPQGISQCTEYFSDRPDVTAIPFGNTAKAAAYVAGCGDKTKAAICSESAAKLYGLDVIARDINSQNDNYTRFIVISKFMNDCGGDKISVMFTLGNTPGTLYGVLRHFAFNNINLTKMESRPQKNKYLLRGYLRQSGRGGKSARTRAPGLRILQDAWRICTRRQPRQNTLSLLFSPYFRKLSFVVGQLQLRAILRKSD